MARQSRTGTGPRVVVITGASAGAGRATAVVFARRGARVRLLAPHVAAEPRLGAGMAALGLRRR